MSRVQVVTLHLEPGLSIARNITEGYGGVLRLSRSVQLDRFSRLRELPPGTGGPDQLAPAAHHAVQRGETRNKNRLLTSRPGI